ncbi:DUF6701 domain-containing protein [Rhodoferax sp.]|uniref:DUF6701 domain-containing protein n=1 Tax=Rhodoferax sp. TaxID=50421 RepID=UPI00284933CD|nr:DUF6701 domain-containing protein [Rhodoferax sp.]MDR3370374.1 hypothetical protein [Rhodoferax sp.]
MAFCFALGSVHGTLIRFDLRAVVCHFKRFTALLVAVSFCGLATAATYTLPDNPPAGCSATSSTSVTCSSLSLNWADSVVVSNANLTLTVTNGVNFGGNNNINISNPVAGFVLYAQTVTVSSSNNINLNGGINTSGSLTLSGGANNITGNLSAGGDILIGGTVTGTVTASGSLVTQWATTITGNVSASSIQSGGSNVFGGNLTATSGNITGGYADKVAGNVSAVNVALSGVSAQVQGCATASSGGSITLAWNTTVGGVCCQSASGCGSSCLTNNSGLPAPGLCSLPALSLSKTVSSSAGVVGDVVTFSITASNTFATPLSNVIVTDTLPTGLSYAASASTLGTVSVSGQVITWTVPSIAASGNAQLTLAVNLLAQGAYTNTASSPGATNASASILVLPAATTDFRMDEPAGSWTGAAGEVLDSGGTGLQGRRVTTSTPTTTNAVSPSPTIAAQNSSVVGGFCNAGNFDGKAVVTVSSNPLLQYTNKLSASAWIYPTVYPSSDLYSILSNDVNYEFHINPSGKLYWWWQASDLTSNTTIPLNKWTHVAITMDSSTSGGRERIYVNGVLDTNTNSWKGTLATNNCDFYIGGDIGTNTGCALIPARNFHGMIDEVKLYNYELSAAEVQADMTLGRSCSGSYDHIQIEHDGVGSVCTPKTVVIKACLDAACSTLYTGNVTLNMATPTGASWVNGATFSFSGGITTRQLSDGTAGTVTLGTSSASPLATNATICKVNGVTNCSMSFAAASCAFDAVESGAAPHTRIYTKLVGTNFNIDVLAMGSGTNINTTYAGTVNVDLVDASTSGCPSSAGLTTAAPLVFVSGNGGRRSITFNYPKAARNVRVRAQVGSTTPACSTDNFAIRPTTFSSIYSTDANADSTGQSASATPAVKAGTTFNVTVDTNKVGYDGTPKVNGALLEWPYVPVGGRASPGVGNLSGGPVFSGAASVSTGNGASGSFTYDEVGYFRFKADGVYDDTFTATSGDQAGGDCVVGDFSNTLNASGKYGCNFGNTSVSNHIGRFIPDHFAVTSSSFAPGCGTFTYMGQTFSTSATVQAQNAGGGKTSNFSGSFFGSATVVPELENANDGVSLSVARLTGLGTPTWAGGEYPFVATGFARLATPDGAYDSLDIGLKVLPLNATDTASLINRDMAASTTVCTADGTGTSNGTCTAKRIATSTKVRFGRLRLQNAFGSEKLALPVPLQAQYWNGGFFVNNADDSCTALSVPAVQTLATGATPAGAPGLYFYPVITGKNQLQSSSTVPTLNSPLTTGQSTLQFPAPQQPGWLDIILQVPNYLMGNWGNCSGQTGAAGLYDDLPCARATFGIYGPKSPIIYRRENY